MVTVMELNSSHCCFVMVNPSFAPFVIVVVVLLLGMLSWLQQGK
jgi:hypothetical protein